MGRLLVPLCALLLLVGCPDSHPGTSRVARRDAANDLDAGASQSADAGARDATLDAAPRDAVAIDAPALACDAPVPAYEGPDCAIATRECIDACADAECASACLDADPTCSACVA